MSLQRKIILHASSICYQACPGAGLYVYLRIQQFVTSVSFHKILYFFTHSIVIGMQLGDDAKSANKDQNDNQDVELKRKRGARHLLKWLLNQSEAVHGCKAARLSESSSVDVSEPKCTSTATRTTPSSCTASTQTLPRLHIIDIVISFPSGHSRARPHLRPNRALSCSQAGQRRRSRHPSPGQSASFHSCSPYSDELSFWLSYACRPSGFFHTS